MPSPDYKPYVENPYTGILDSVAWPSARPTLFSVFWVATLIGDPYPFYETGLTVMDVSVGGLPALRSHLAVGTILIDTGLPSPVPFTIWEDRATGDFPDGDSGTLSALYFMTQSPVPIGGEVQYQTTARGDDRFGGADSVSIAIAISLRGVRGGSGYNWTASATGAAGAPELSGTAPSGGTINLNATLVFNPPSISFGQ